MTTMREILRRFTPPDKRPFQLIQIEPSLLCSLECVMCPWTGLRSQGGMMSWETFESIMPQLSLADEVDFTGGGESLKHPRLLEMIAAAKSSGCRVGFSTNAMLLDEATAHALIELGLDWISFSVDAASPRLYERIRQGASYMRVIGNIAGLSDLKRRMGANTPRMMMVFVMMTGEHKNYHELPQYVELAASLGVEQVIAKNLDVIIKDGDDERRVFSHSGESLASLEAAIAAAEENARRLDVGLRVYARAPHEQAVCEHRPDRNLYINWQGYVSPCITLSYAESRVFDGQRVEVPAQLYGNVAQSPLWDIWGRADYADFRKVYAQRQTLERIAAFEALSGGDSRALPEAPEGCRSCYYLYGI